MAQVCMLARMLYVGVQAGRMSYELVLCAGDLLAVNRARLTDQQAGRDNSSDRPVFYDPEIKSCEKASPGQKRDYLGWRRRLLIFDRRKDSAARKKFPIGAQRDRYGSDRNEIPNSKFLGGRHDKSRNETFPNFLGDRAGPTENILDFKYQVGQQLVRHHELLKPDKFDGPGCLKTFLKKFEICAMYNRWSMDNMEAYLSCSLTGEAAKVLWDLAELGYQELVTKLENRYGTSGHEESYRYELQTLRRKPEIFLFALNDADLELKVRNMQDTTENKMKAVERQMNALHQSVDFIHSHKVQSAVPRIRGDKICFDSVKPGVFISQCSQKNIPNKFQSSNQKGRNNCYRCEKSGHFKREFPEKEKSNKQSKRVNKSNENDDQTLYLPISGHTYQKIAEGCEQYRDSNKEENEAMDKEVILGLDWLVNNKVSWKFGKAQITIGNKNIIMKLITKRLSERRLCRIYSNVEVQLPARAEIDVPTKLVVRQPSKLTLTDCVCSEAKQVTSVDLVYRLPNESSLGEAYPEFVKQVLNRSLVAHQLAQERLKTVPLYKKSLSDSKVKVLTLQPRDKIWYLYPRS
ncbi:hypothetical protein HELRODRAFT_183585 [Helobdella robusta]|uniref:CCHC-type domain-containing protein n=1 Tax=Helobdella robusta TaxID=6412 RepID=T1FJV8_HELRO|nr:hypothetical protein HELRODRAFT_183585 [Helobdella robusta]ESO10485.1 hypothetical protein HELRODRAFT_183585 [Helobdella robusta]